MRWRMVSGSAAALLSLLLLVWLGSVESRSLFAVRGGAGALSAAGPLSALLLPQQRKRVVPAADETPLASLAAKKNIKQNREKKSKKRRTEPREDEESQKETKKESSQSALQRRKGFSLFHLFSRREKEKETATEGSEESPALSRQAERRMLIVQRVLFALPPLLHMLLKSRLAELLKTHADFAHNETHQFLARLCFAGYMLGSQALYWLLKRRITRRDDHSMLSAAPPALPAGFSSLAALLPAARPLPITVMAYDLQENRRLRGLLLVDLVRVLFLYGVRGDYAALLYVPLGGLVRAAQHPLVLLHLLNMRPIGLCKRPFPSTIEKLLSMFSVEIDDGESGAVAAVPAQSEIESEIESQSESESETSVSSVSEESESAEGVESEEDQSVAVESESEREGDREMEEQCVVVEEDLEITEQEDVAPRDAENDAVEEEQERNEDDADNADESVTESEQRAALEEEESALWGDEEDEVETQREFTDEELDALEKEIDALADEQ